MTDGSDSCGKRPKHAVQQRSKDAVPLLFGWRKAES